MRKSYLLEGDQLLHECANTEGSDHNECCREREDSREGSVKRNNSNAGTYRPGTLKMSSRLPQAPFAASS